jgi:hypothetical protein
MRLIPAQIAEDMAKIDRFLTLSNVRGALKEITQKLKPGTYALAGGLAVGHWIHNRETRDLDFALAAQDVGHLKKLFPHPFSEGSGIYSTKISAVRVDFLKPAAYRWNREAIQHARAQFVEDVDISVVTPEYLVLYKMHAERELDQIDAIALLKLPGVYKKARRLVERFLSPQHAEDLDQLAKYP